MKMLFFLKKAIRGSLYKTEKPEKSYALFEKSFKKGKKVYFSIKNSLQASKAAISSFATARMRSPSTLTTRRS